MPSSTAFLLVGLVYYTLQQLPMSVGYLLKYIFYVHQYRHWQILELMFVNNFHPKAVETFICIHRGFTFLKTNKPKRKKVCHIL